MKKWYTVPALVGILTPALLPPWTRAALGCADSSDDLERR